MNFLAHVWVACTCGMETPESLLGSALPDLASMAGVRLRWDRLDGQVAAGVDMHVRSDAAFHDHPEFLAGSQHLRGRLLAAGVGSGPARAVGHAGWELLLDGTLVGFAAVVESMQAGLDAAEAAAPAIGPPDLGRWRRFVERMGPPMWGEYATTAGVARRLEATLDGRPRLRIPDEHLDAVEAALAESREAIAVVGPGVLADVAKHSA